MPVSLNTTNFSIPNNQSSSFAERGEKKGADTLLNRIEKVMQKALECSNAFVGFLELLKQKAKVLRDGCMQKASQLPFFKRFFGHVGQQEKNIIATQIPPQQFLYLPDDMIRSIFNLLGIRDIKNMRLNMCLSALAREETIRRAKEYDFEEDGFPKAYNYLKALFQAMDKLVEFHHIPNKYVIYHGWMPLFRSIDSEATFRNIRHLNEVKPYLNKTLLKYGKYKYPTAMMFRMLLVLGADPNIRNNSGRTPLWLATQTHSYKELIPLLLKYDADPNIAENCINATPLIAAVFDSEIVELLCEKGVDVNHKTKPDGNTTLHSAVHNRKLDTVRVLLKYGANRNIIDKNGETPLDRAKKSTSDEKIVEIITLLKSDRRI